MVSSRQYVALCVLFMVFWASRVLGYSGGDGTPVNPYQLATVADFMQLSNTPGDWNKSFVMTADIDLAGITFTQAPIAPSSEQPFMGVFDGKGYALSNLKIAASGKMHVGLIGRIGQPSLIKNLGIQNAQIQGGGTVGGLVGRNDYGRIDSCYVKGFVGGTSPLIGGLVGHNYNGIVSDCYTMGVVTGTSMAVGGLAGENYSFNQGFGSVYNCYSSSVVSGMDMVGGLIGRNSGNSPVIRLCYAIGTVSANSQLGGLVGLNEPGCIIEFCYSSGSVIGTSIASGGLAGRNRGTIKNCYAAGTVISKGPVLGGLVGENNGPVTDSYSTTMVVASMMGTDAVGGLLGRNSDSKVTNCYAAGIVQAVGINIGGLIGSCSNPALAVSCFWDIQVSGQTASAGGTGQTTVQMQILDTFTSAGWDFNSIEADWVLSDEGVEYPKLVWQTAPTYSGGDGTAANPYQIATVDDFKNLSDTPPHWGKCFILTSDIDLNGILFSKSPISPCIIENPRGFQGIPFRGIFDGNGHAICNLTITAPTKYYVGLFGHIGDGQVKNLGLRNVSVEGNRYVGGLAGSSYGTVTHSYTTGSVKGKDLVGGLIGFVGYYQSSPPVQYSEISNSYSICSVEAIFHAAGLTGGGEYCKISFCYAACSVYPNKYAQGLIGMNARNCVVTASFWDIEAFGQTRSPGIFGKTTAEMMTRSTFTDARWDFAGETANGTEDIWTIREDKTYPQFVWQNTPPVADAGQDRTVYAWFDGNADVTLDGSASSDEDGDALDYAWMLNGQLAAAECNPTLLLPVGVHTLSLVVSDGLAESEPDEVVITIVAAKTGDLKILPSAINRKSNMPQVMAMFQLPRGVNVLEGKVSLYPGGIECQTQQLVRIGQCTTVFAWFSKEKLMQAVTETGNVELTLVGKQSDGPYLYGKDCVKIIH